jgi:hypothetical protein
MPSVHRTNGTGRGQTNNETRPDEMRWRVQGKQDLESEVVPCGTAQGANEVECVIASFIACEDSQGTFTFTF